MLVVTGCTSVPRSTGVPRKTTLSAERVELPTSMSNDALFVEARLNGRGPYRFLVDTGASGLFLPANLASAIGLKPISGSYGEAQGEAGRVKTQQTQVNLFECGGLKLENLRATLLSEADFENSRSVFVWIDGVLGMDALRDVLLEFDFPRQRIAISRRSAAQLPVAVAVSYTGTVPEVKMEIAGKIVPIVIDTGFNGVLAVPNFEGLPLMYPPMKEDGAAIAAGTKWTRSEVSQLSGDARVGPVIWRRPSIETGSGLVGAGALAKWKLVFDQHARRVYFIGTDSVTQWPAALPADLASRMGVFVQIESDGLRLLEVDVGGACNRAGLRPGDVILTMDGKPAAGFIAAPSEPEPDRRNVRRRKLQVRRDGREFEVVLILEADTPKQRHGTS